MKHLIDFFRWLGAVLVVVSALYFAVHVLFGCVQMDRDPTAAAVSGYPAIRDSLVSVYKIDGRRAVLLSYYIGFNADRYEVPWQEVVAVMRVESNFDQLALSDSGAVGLMQILPSTGFILAGKLNMSWPGTWILYLPEYNIRIGTFYLSMLKKLLDGSYEAAAKSYYIGIGDYYAGRKPQSAADYWQKTLVEYKKLHPALKKERL